MGIGDSYQLSVISYQLERAGGAGEAEGAEGAGRVGGAGEAGGAEEEISSLLPIAYSLLPIAHCLFPIPCSLFPIPYILNSK